MTFDASKSVLLILNPVAGRRRRGLVDGVVAHLRAEGWTVDVVETAAAGDARRIAATCDATRHAVVAVAGGDGTVNEALNGLIQRTQASASPALAVIPLGTANVLAHELGLGFSAPSIAETIVAGRSLLLRPGQLQADGVAAARCFGLMAGAGFDAWVVAGVSPALKRRWGKAAYVWRSLVETWRYRPVRYAVEIDGTRHVVASVVVTHARHYAGPWIIAPDAALERPCLAICLFERWGRWSVLRFALALFLGHLPDMPGFRIVTGRSIRISLIDAASDMAGRSPTQVDGDPALPLPVSVTLSDATVSLLRPV